MSKLSIFSVVVTVIAGMSACSPAGQDEQKNIDLPVASQDFEATVDGQPVKLYTLKNGEIQVTITNYGGRVVSIQTPDRDGNFVDVVVGYKDLAGFQQAGDGFYGALIGRYGNRIGKGQFELDGLVYQVDRNDGENSLHGGTAGFHARVWSVQSVTDTSLVLHYASADGESGYPGNLEAKVTYSLRGSGLAIAYEAATDKATPVNLTNHTYFNLSGEGAATILDHELWIAADQFTPVDGTLIPTGELRDVAGTPFDFRQAETIGARIGDQDEQLVLGKGYDHNFVLSRTGKDLGTVASVYSPVTGIYMDVLTEEPGLQFYSGNFMDQVAGGKGDKIYGFRSAFCLETQHFPDSPNHAHFPSTLLEPGQTYRTQTVYKFGVK